MLNRGSFGVTTYSYDALGQLLAEWGPDTYRRTWSFDPAGNRLTEQSTPGSWETRVAYLVTCTFDAVDRQVSEQTTGNQAGNTLAGSSSLNTFSYDGNDCRISEQSQKLTASGSTVYLTTYTWDPAQRLIQGIDGLNGTVQTNLYRPDGLRHQMTNTASGFGGYVWDGTDLLAEVDQNGNLRNAFYSRGTKLLKYHRLTAPTDLYFNFDRLGSAGALSNPDGTLNSQYHLPAWGGLGGGLQTAISSPFYIREPGYISALEVFARPMFYVRARWYLAGGPGWLSPEPLRFDLGDGDLYRYVGNNPVSFIDPSGQLQKEACEEELKHLQTIIDKLKEKHAPYPGTIWHHHPNRQPGEIRNFCQGIKSRMDALSGCWQFLDEIPDMRCQVLTINKLWDMWCNPPPPRPKLAPRPTPREKKPAKVLRSNRRYRLSLNLDLNLSPQATTWIIVGGIAVLVLTGGLSAPEELAVLAGTAAF